MALPTSPPEPVARATSALVISLDFELHWGVCERVDGPKHPYAANLRGAREVIPRLLDRFRRRRVHATWATVGALFARGRDDFEAFAPRLRPRYARAAADTYRLRLGDSEADDPLHFAPSLVDRIAETPGQELASHTFSHYLCDEPGQDRDAFVADLRAAQAIAARRGLRLRSLVLPRNEVRADYVSALADAGFDTYRGNPRGGLYDAAPGPISSRARRALRLMDSYVEVTGHQTIAWRDIASGPPHDVPASQLLRPRSRRLRGLEPLRVARVVRGMRTAAERGEVFHLWWHPHNLGAEQDANLAVLDRILDELERLRERRGMQSLSMGEAVDRALADRGSARAVRAS